MINNSASQTVRPQLAVVTVTYNSARVLPKFLASLAQQSDLAWTVIAIDNASSDGSVEQLVAWGDPRLQLVRNVANVGFAKATNQGMQIAIEQGIPWVLILNNDTSFAPGSFSMLMARAGQGDAAVYAPHIVYDSNPQMTWYGGGRFSNAWGFRATLEGERRVNWDGAHHERWVDFAPGCCKLVSTELLRKSGLYDEDFFVYWEDVDICWRWSQQGIKVRYLTNPTILHDVSSLTGGEFSPFSLRMYQLNQVLFLRKNFAVASVMLRLLLIVCKIAARLVVGRDRPSQTRARIAAVMEGLRYHLIPVAEVPQRSKGAPDASIV